MAIDLKKPGTNSVLVFWMVWALIRILLHHPYMMAPKRKVLKAILWFPLVPIELGMIFYYLYLCNITYYFNHLLILFPIVSLSLAFLLVFWMLKTKTVTLKNLYFLMILPCLLPGAVLSSIFMNMPYNYYDEQNCRDFELENWVKPIAFAPLCSELEPEQRRACENSVGQNADLIFHPGLNAIYIVHAKPHLKWRGEISAPSRLLLDDNREIVSFKTIDVGPQNPIYSHVFFDSIRNEIYLTFWDWGYIGRADPEVWELEEVLFQELSNQIFNGRSFFQQSTVTPDGTKVVSVMEKPSFWLFSHNQETGKDKAVEIKRIAFPFLKPSILNYVIFDVLAAADIFNVFIYDILATDDFLFINSIQSHVWKVALDSFELVAETKLGGKTADMEYDREKNLIYVAKVSSNKVIVLNAETLTLYDEFETSDGPRDLAMDKKRGLLYVTNYFEGAVEIFRLSDHSQVVRSPIGPMARNLYFCPVSGRVFAVSQCGVFEILPDLALPEQQSWQ